MNFRRTVMSVVFLLSVSALAHAQAPAGATGQCKDGTYSIAKSKSGACSGHEGVQSRYATSSSSAVGPAKPAAVPSSSAMPAPKPAPTPMTNQQGTGGGQGQVWVNTSTKVYHCVGDRYYGKTKKGEYMSEADAVSKGARPDAGKSCPK